MNIDLSVDFGHGEKRKYQLQASTSDATIKEGWLSIDEVRDTVVPLFEDMIYYMDISTYEVIDTLIKFGIVDKDMIQQWVEDNKDEEGL